MLIVGELINGSRLAIAEAMAARDAQVILKVAQEQVAAGAQLLDVNAGGDPTREVENLLWLVEVIRSELNVSLCIDSPNAEAMQAGLQRAGKQAAMMNSITAEKSRLEGFLPLVEAHRCQVIALCMDDSGVPKGAHERLEIGQRLVNKIVARGIRPQNIFLDPIVYPLSVEVKGGSMARETLRLIKKELPDVMTICGLSNISYGLPQRHLLNRTFLTVMLAEGLDAAILDPTDKALMAQMTAAETLMGRDEHCLAYIAAHRQGKLI